VDERATFIRRYTTSTDIGGTIALLMMMQHFKNGGLSHAQNERDKEQKRKKRGQHIPSFFSPTNINLYSRKAYE